MLIALDGLQEFVTARNKLAYRDLEWQWIM